MLNHINKQESFPCFTLNFPLGHFGGGGVVVGTTELDEGITVDVVLGLIEDIE